MKKVYKKKDLGKHRYSWAICGGIYRLGIKFYDNGLILTRNKQSIILDDTEAQFLKERIDDFIKDKEFVERL